MRLFFYDDETKKEIVEICRTESFFHQYSTYKGILKYYPQAELTKALVYKNNKVRDVKSQLLKLIELRDNGNNVPNKVIFRGKWLDKEAIN